MRTRIQGLVQLKTGDAVRGVIARLSWPWKYLRVDMAEAFSINDPEGGPTRVDGVVWIPKSNVAYVQEVPVVPVINVETPVIKPQVTVLTPGGRVAEEE